jgi:hypothetical protein
MNIQIIIQAFIRTSTIKFLQNLPNSFRVQTSGRSARQTSHLPTCQFSQFKHFLQRKNNKKNRTLLLLLFYLPAIGVLPGGSSTTIGHNRQVTHTQSNNTHKVRTHYKHYDIINKNKKVD